MMVSSAPFSAPFDPPIFFKSENLFHRMMRGDVISDILTRHT